MAFIIGFQHKLKSRTGAAFPGSSEVGDVRKEVKATVSMAIKKFGPDALKGFLPYFQYFPLNSLDFIVLFWRLLLPWLLQPQSRSQDGSEYNLKWECTFQ